MVEAINLVNNFNVEKIIFNWGEFNDLESDLIKVLEKKNIEYYSCIKELNIDKYKLQFLNTGVYDNENDNSNIIYTKLNNYKFAKEQNLFIWELEPKIKNNEYERLDK